MTKRRPPVDVAVDIEISVSQPSTCLHRPENVPPRPIAASERSRWEKGLAKPLWMR